MFTTKYYINHSEKPVLWSEFVDVLKQNVDKSHDCRIPLHGKHLLTNHETVNSSHPEIIDGYACTRARWQNPGVIYFTFVIEEGDRGDEDGYGVEPDHFLVAIADKEGNFPLPFTACESKEAQWKALEYGITPLHCDADVLAKFNEQYNRKWYKK